MLNVLNLAYLLKWLLSTLVHTPVLGHPAFCYCCQSANTCNSLSWTFLEMVVPFSFLVCPWTQYWWLFSVCSVLHAAGTIPRRSSDFIQHTRDAIPVRLQRLLLDHLFLPSGLEWYLAFVAEPCLIPETFCNTLATVSILLPSQFCPLLSLKTRDWQSFSVRGPDGKYFMLCRPHMVSVTYSTPPHPFKNIKAVFDLS